MYGGGQQGDMACEYGGQWRNLVIVAEHYDERRLRSGLEYGKMFVQWDPMAYSSRIGHVTTGQEHDDRPRALERTWRTA